MTRARLAQERKAFLRFVESVHNLSYDPGPANLERYLAASSALEESRSAVPTPPQARAKNLECRGATQHGRWRESHHGRTRFQRAKGERR
jgi:hypothetical protein